MLVQLLFNKMGVLNMNFTSQDIIVIERALQLAIRSETKETKAEEYREVLHKLQLSSMQALQEQSAVTTAVQDGIRYDYDDSSDLV
ncbi:hypothetical protein PC41400_13155 [Paenibacillus chitinolyticus]|uniref:Uncharacterized protein n=1 Tax=Paenibacillus chitinolyticus TaxID=79263 RepID=A0A410WWG8_9BACL|nr:hypothetical protein [Paenibacillus chitinolyticus]MCY9592189.1 hypothetical protein [Paenibacillus chitinolyticus]MCY9594165.1 hypothetical protein [Paenibacillus chitinolyticus]QAV18571.1 hypothetical protein PC41400_13155 [Paenibacillus chitinolyticus]